MPLPAAWGDSRRTKAAAIAEASATTAMVTSRPGVCQLRACSIQIPRSKSTRCRVKRNKATRRPVSVPVMQDQKAMRRTDRCFFRDLYKVLSCSTADTDSRDKSMSGGSPVSASYCYQDGDRVGMKHAGTKHDDLPHLR